MTIPHAILQSALSEVGIEKPSDVSLVLERAREMMAAKETLQDELREKAREIYGKTRYGNLYDRSADKLDKYALLAAASSTLVEEMKAMGYGETSDKPLPGAWDRFVEALARARG